MYPFTSLYDSFHFELFFRCLEHWIETFLVRMNGLYSNFCVLGVLLLCMLGWNEMFVVPVVALDP